MNRFTRSLLLASAMASAVTSCTGTPTERAAKAAKAEEDLCKIRNAEAAAEAVYPSTAPTPGSIRQQIEAAEDEFCAARAALDAGK